MSVRTRTSAIERFVLPKGNGKQKQKPPKARFIWQDLQLDGIIEDLAIDFTLFASDGTPLRAKMSVTMKGAGREVPARQAGARREWRGECETAGREQRRPGQFRRELWSERKRKALPRRRRDLAPGISRRRRAPDSTRMALSGESAAEFATRNGLDPAAWRGVTGGSRSGSRSLKGGGRR